MKFPLIHRLEASHSYGLLLAVILVSLTFQSSAPDTRASRLVVVGLSAGTLLLALWTSRTPERDRRLGMVAVLVGVAASTVLAFSNDPRLYKGGLIVVGGLIVLVVPLVIAQAVFHSVRERGRVTLQEAFGALCVYLVIGMLFAFAFGAVAVLQHGPLFTNGSEGDLQAHIYFSFTTITTVGYGDLSPAGDLAHTFSILEALIGQLYLVTVVAVIVGNIAPRDRG